MATPTIKSTYSLDLESVHTLEALARDWKVSKSEVLRRAIRVVAQQQSPAGSAALNALDQLQTSLRLRNVDLAQWEREVKDERHASARRLIPGTK